ncbi:hypothetical protein AKJ41_04660 [candidate division MSBL1 archaeon SCGC-AAA259O05]|uniref:Transposase IS66 central domain-containing protein n=1 Tax=candidate division MSBL1 archaeon SCGC-AAA259O05 TaxID=1698271 RepID=A0A133V0G7_9EURY|nr:hypothetical protein AKJ41_04660 [candidate division MSBL1 archaeon SCGC-AAA259O05]
MISQATSFSECSLMCPRVAELEERVQELEVKLIIKEGYIKELKNELRKHVNPHTPSSKKRKKKTERNRKKEKTEEDKEDEESEKEEGAETEDEGERFPGKPKGSNGGGISIPDPDDVEHHTLDEDGLEEIDTWEKTVIEFPENPFRVVKHVIHVYKDEEGREVEPEVNLPKGIYGKRFQAFDTLLRGTCGASHEKIAELVRQVRPDLSFSSTTSLNITDNMARQLEGERQRILEKVRQNKFVHMDETPLRIDGANGWVWVFADKQNVVYVVSRSRSKDIPERVMGNYGGTGVVDGYVAYNGFTRQRDWEHLRREVRDTKIEDTVTHYHELYDRAKKMKEKPPPERERFIQKAQGKEFPELIATLRENRRNKKAIKTATKIENALPNMFRGVRDPDIPLNNSHAERLLRKVVVHRKLWGCIRNEKGKRFVDNTLSCMETWKLQGKNVFEELQKFAS